MLSKYNLLLPNLGIIRKFSTSFVNVPLTQSLPNFFANSSSALFPRKSAQITQLGNGLTVATQDKFGIQCTLGGLRLLPLTMYLLVVVKAGPRYESGTISGVSHFLEKLGFYVISL